MHIYVYKEGGGRRVYVQTHRYRTTGLRRPRLVQLVLRRTAPLGRLFRFLLVLP